MARAAPRILIFEHMPAGHPGLFRDLLRADDVAHRTVRLDLGERIPDLADFDALIVMGGPMDVWQEAAYPWLRDEKAAIRQAVRKHGMAFLGICLGHQLLAEALGGAVGPMAEPEIGPLEIARSGGPDRSLLAGLPARATVLQWHAAEVTAPPSGAEVLAASPRSAVQAMAVGDRAIGLQFHAEVTDGLLSEWLAVHDNAAALARQLGPDGPARFEHAARGHMAGFNRVARPIYEAFRTWL
jgi:GMP synthase-like glutamine amidotransferase